MLRYNDFFAVLAAGNHLDKAFDNPVDLDWIGALRVKMRSGWIGLLWKKDSGVGYIFEISRQLGHLPHLQEGCPAFPNSQMRYRNFLAHIRAPAMEHGRAVELWIPDCKNAKEGLLPTFFPPLMTVFVWLLMIWLRMAGGACYKFCQLYLECLFAVRPA
jgi:hypothetical protein